MAFTITSAYADRLTPRPKPLTVTWDAGTLAGDPGLVAQLTAILDGRWVYPVPGVVCRADIQDGLSVAAAASLLWPRCDFAGDVPTVPPLSEGAIG